MDFIVLRYVSCLIFIMNTCMGWTIDKIKSGFQDYELYVHEIIDAYAQEVEQELGLICIGSGGKMPKDVEEVRVALAAYQVANVEQARELEVKATEKLIDKINQHSKIRPYLKTFPFPAEGAEVSISFRKNNNTHHKDGNLSYVTQVRNKIYYQIDDGVSPINITIKEEPYEEALKIVQGK